MVFDSLVQIPPVYSQVTSQAITKPKYSCDYAVTITLKPLMYKHTSEVQYEKTYRQLCELFTKNECKFTLVTELTAQYNVHYHGILSCPLSKGNDIRKFLFDRLRKLSYVGKSTIDQVTNYNEWLEYIMKDQTKEHYFVYPILANDYKVDVAIQPNYRIRKSGTPKETLPTQKNIYIR